ncbi:MAG: hypothetical protein Q9174_000428 [Haloplaca sp. 1 TL-2023]
MRSKRKRESNGKDTIDDERQATVSPSETGGASLIQSIDQETPSKRRRGRPLSSTTKTNVTPTSPSYQHISASTQPAELLFKTPSRAERARLRNHATARDTRQSARGKSARATMEPKMAAGDSDDEDSLAERIREAEQNGYEEFPGSDDDEPVAKTVEPAGPSKGGKKGPRRRRSSTPPHHLPPHEQYFFQNRAGKTKTSNNTFSSHSLLSHEQYHHRIEAYEDPHASSYAFLHSLHSRSFPQWRFELSQSFSICLYGYGSKRHLTNSFAKYLHSVQSSSPPKVIMINGYVPSLNIRQVFTTIASIVFDCPVSSLRKVGSQPRDIIHNILEELNSSPPAQPFILIINSLDARPLRCGRTPALLAELASSPHIQLLATCDTLNFPLLWDTSLRDQYNWLFHDTTTFVSYGGVEIEDVVEEVNELVGRSRRRIKGKEGVGFVLKSVPENARALYRVLIAELLSHQESGLGGYGDDALGGNDAEDNDDIDEFALLGTPGKSATGAAGAAGEPCIEYRTLYQKVVEEFICSSEMGFRQLLKEFHDHQMIAVRRDATGTEMLGVPFRREEMEAILEDLMV